MSRTVAMINPIFTQRCAHPECGEVIYRDTLDTDDAWQVDDGEVRKFTCSPDHALDLVNNQLFWNMAINRKHFSEVY